MFQDILPSRPFVCGCLSWQAKEIAMPATAKPPARPAGAAAPAARRLATGEPDTRPRTRSQMIAAIKAIAARSGKGTVTREEFARATGLSLEFVARRCGFSGLVRAAGLRRSPHGNPIPEDELMAALREAVLARQGLLTSTEFGRIGRYSVETYHSRYGGWYRALAAFATWIEAREPDFAYLPQLRATLASSRRIVRRPVVAMPRDERAYGALIRSPALLHAPTNENGVIYLFGALAAELGFVVETVTPGFPDCTAKRRLDTRGERWTRVRIEFEHESRNFNDHGHDPAACDLIVCWHHNWPECPVEVLELKQKVEARP
jgi:hypothetical protein